MKVLMNINKASWHIKKYTNNPTEYNKNEGATGEDKGSK